MATQRNNYGAEFKARVALEALKGIKTVQQIARDFDLHPVQVTTWKKQLQEQCSSVFEAGREQAQGEDFERERTALHSKIGELSVQVDFLRKKSRQLGLCGDSASWSKNTQA